MVNDTDLYEQILSLNATAAEAGQFEVAYHLLAAALHAAATGRDRSRIEAVIRLADNQGAAVEAAHDHPMSASNARTRGHSPLYDTLMATARGRLAQLDSQRIIDEQHTAR
jgi:hypothetical protein